MPNTDAAFGFRPVQHLDGSPWNGKVTMYYVPQAYATALFVGDPVIADSAGGAAGVTVNGIDVEGMAGIIAASASSVTNRGVITGFLPLQSNLEMLYNPACTARIALVCDSPDVVYEVQEDGVGSTIAGGDIGENCDMITYAAGRSITGRSLMQLDSSTAVSTTAQWRILGLSKRPGNVLGSFAKWLVVMNEHSFKTTTGD